MAHYVRPEIRDLLEMMDLSEKEKLAAYLQEIIAAEKNVPPKTRIQEQWEEIRRLVKFLEFEPYIDDQWEIKEVWDLCDDIAGSDELRYEPWERRKEMLSYIIDGDYYSDYSLDEGMRKLFAALCSTPEEKRECADLAVRTGSEFVMSDTAKYYLECGMPEKYYRYLEERLGRDEDRYMEVIGYYRDTDPEKAAEIAERGLKKCDRQTELMIYLLQKAAEDGDVTKFGRLMSGAKRRRAVNYEIVLAALAEKYGSENPFLLE